ncbi:MAG: RusA family crossover junction endodeoxyribonuclease [Deltaproteobacteria bacterium]|nr:RusA family crossover junction endodeoxyribonuclease [Deltaproteobacteria bacterium]
MKINIKPLSVNACYRGRRFKTPAYKQYEKDVLIQLKAMSVPEGELELHIQAGFSNKGADLDNIAKVFIDILQVKYNFNDSRIYHISLYKRIVPKGDEYISFDLFECLKGVSDEI